MFHSLRFAHVTITDNLLNQLLPGPVTLIFRRRDALPLTVNEVSSNVGVRVPDARFVRALCERVDGGAVALTSANRSGDLSALETWVSAAGTGSFQVSKPSLVGLIRSRKLGFFKFVYWFSQQFAELHAHLDIVVDGGPIANNVAVPEELRRAGSTVVDLSVAGEYKLVRDGWCVQFVWAFLFILDKIVCVFAI
jgi:tRNA A37 threonylcarbamoyladenosine synthetase subunit TsaC/SUA5/YrdC